MPNSPSAASVASDVVGVPDDEGPRLPKESLGLRWPWLSRRRRLQDADLCGAEPEIAEAKRWRKALDNESMTAEVLDDLAWSTAYVIPAVARSDRVLLLDTRHAQYLERAREYLDGTVEELPLQRCKALWVYPSSFARSDLRSKMSHTLQACKAFGVFLHTRDWDLYGDTPDKPGRYAPESRLVVAPSYFPAIPEDIFSAWPSVGLPFDIPLMATYYGMARSSMDAAMAERYDRACRHEFALFTAIALHTEAVNTKRLWQLSEKCVQFIRENVTASLPPLERSRSIGPLPMSVLLEKVDRVENIPSSWLTRRHVGVGHGWAVGWDEDAGETVQVIHPPPRNRRRNTGYGAGPSQPQGAPSREYQGSAPFRASAPQTLPEFLQFSLPTSTWRLAVGSSPLLDALGWEAYDTWSAYQVLYRCNTLYENAREAARAARVDATRLSAEATETKKTLDELRTASEAAKSASTRVVQDWDEIGTLRTSLSRVRAERNCLREELEGLKAQVTMLKRQRDDWKELCDGQHRLSKAGRGACSARAEDASSPEVSPRPAKRSRAARDSTDSLVVLPDSDEESPRGRGNATSRVQPRRLTRKHGRD